MTLQPSLLIPMLPYNSLSPGFIVLEKTVGFESLNYNFLPSLAYSAIIAVLPAADAGLLMALQADPAIAC